MTDTTEQPAPPRSASVGFGLAWMMALGLTLCMLPIIGPFLAGVVGGRRIRDLRSAVLVSIIPLLFIGGTLTAMTHQGIRVGGANSVFLPQGFVWLQCLALISGVLTGAGRGFVRGVGLVLFVASIVVFQGEARPYWAVLRTIQSAQAPPSEPEKTGCAENLRKLHNAIMMYASDWDDTLPPAGRWMTVLTTGEERKAQDGILHCPQAGKLGTAQYGYAMNAALSGKKWRQIDQKEHARTPLIYDSSDLGINAHYDFTSLPNPGRHSGHNNILYLDGHVEAR